jgi:hypothetical protein
MSKQGSLLWVACLLVTSPHLTTAEPLPRDTDRNPGRDHFPAKKPLEKEKESLKQRGDPPLRKVRHLDGTIDGWSVADSPNFRVFHSETPEFAEKVAQAAERTRSAMQRKWFGDADEDWSSRCEIYLHPTAQYFSWATGAPTSIPGYTRTRADGDRVLSRRVDLSCEDPNLLAAVLPHEISHAVLAGRFGWSAIPHWVNEGMAVLSEPQEKIDAHLRRLPRYRRAGDLFPAEQLLELQEYPERRLMGVFYAESVSLVDFLAQEKGPKTFCRFMRDGLRNGFEKALKSNYGWDLDELDSRWRNYAFKEVSSSSAEKAK